jgi:2-polyprenyl-3-methyl-5-hydroxy-6-metoxy-1,4-benzoquinol methylase
VEESLYQRMYETEERHWWFVVRRSILREVIEKECGLQAGDTIVDVGCGTGAMLKALQPKFRVLGLDASPLAIKYTKNRGIEHVYQGLLEALPSTETNIRAALLLDVIEHIDDDAAVLRSVSERLAPDGRIVITVPAFSWLWSAHDEAHHHKRRYDAARLREALERAGLEPLRLTYFNTLLFPLAAVRKVLYANKTIDEAQAATDMPAAPLNALFRSIFSLEKAILPKADLPFGVSLLAIARRKVS